MKNRIVSVDLFRGLTVMFMTIVNNPGDWANLYPPLAHAEWHGCTPTDLVFPFFLFIMGTSVPLALRNQTLDADVVGKVVTRALRIFGLGFFLAFFSKIQFFGLDGSNLLLVRLLITAFVFALLLGNYNIKLQFYAALFFLSVLFILAYGGFAPFKNVRVPGVLQRIALVYLAVAIIYLKYPLNKQVLFLLLLLLGYWLTMQFIPFGSSGAGTLEPGNNFAAFVDLPILNGHMWSVTETWDPEGLYSTLPAIATGLLGVLTGWYLKKKLAFYWFILGGVVFVILGWLWSLHFPLNKALWTSSFVLYTAGWALLLLGCLQFFTETKKWMIPILAFGVNPMLVFFASGIIPRALGMLRIQDQNLQSFLYSHFIEIYFTDPKMASLAGALVYLCIWTAILLYFYSKKSIFKV